MRKIKAWSISKKILVSLVVLILAVTLSTGIQFAINMTIKSEPQRPIESIDAGGSDRLIYYYDQYLNHDTLPDGIELNELFVNSELEGTYAYIDGRYDCSDFRMNSLVRLYYAYGDQLPDSTKANIKRVMLDFKYWMDQGGSDSMCYWSENHQILFATQEYLVGQAFPNDRFTVDNKLGSEHMEMAEARINAWMNQRYLYGFTEWYSNNYYPEDIAPMANFIQFSEDEEMVNRMKMIMDLIWFDMASQSYKFEGLDEGGDPRTYYVFVSSSGRMYSDNRVSDDIGNRMRNYIDYIVQKEETRAFSKSWSTSTNGFFNCFKQMIEAEDTEGHPYYEVPAVIKAIFDDPSETKTIRSSQSLDVEELAGEGLLGQEDNQIMMQWDMEAFTNPPVIQNTVKYIAKNKMFTNDFLKDFALINLWPLRAFGLLGSVSRLLDPSTNGVAIERANVYTYKTANYAMSNAQAYQPGEYADQQSINSLNLTNYLSVFTTQPAKIPRRSGTPTYWSGNGRQPYSVQERNVTLQVYLPPEKTGFMEPMVVKEMTHVFFPFELFDEVDETYLNEGYIFGRADSSYVMIKARYALEFVDFAVSDIEGNRDDMLVRGSANDVLAERYDLVQTGPGYHYFVIEASSADSETFADFISRTLANTLSFEADTGALSYASVLDGSTDLTELRAVYAEGFYLDDVIQNLQYARYENPYVTGGLTARKAGILSFTYLNKTLTLDYENNIRTVGD